MEDTELLLSGIQHYCFCRRQWALIHVENQWVENHLTAEGRKDHSRVHDQSIVDVRDQAVTYRGLQVRSEKWGVHGICDAVEFIPDDSGITLNKREGKWVGYPVEYKHGSPKVNDCDRLQAAVQAMCLEEMLGIPVKKAYLFYYETRHRECIQLTDDLMLEAQTMLTEMHDMLKRRYTPMAKVGKWCDSCSLSSVCMPELMAKGREEVGSYVARHIKEALQCEDY